MRIKKNRIGFFFNLVSVSVAIFMYLCDKYNKPDWYPTETRERARVNEYANWQHLNLRASGAMLFRAKVKIQDVFFFLRD